jgi:hypothetical protein
MGTLVLKAQISVCQSVMPIAASAVIDGDTVLSDTSIQLAPGTYTIIPDDIEGASAEAVTVTISDAQTSSVTLEYSSEVELSLSTNSLELKAGETATISATASTLSPVAVPVEVVFTLPEGLEAAGQSVGGTITLGGEVSNDQPLTVEIAVRAVSGVDPTSLENAEIIAEIVSCNLSEVVTLSTVINALPPERRESRVSLLARLSDVPAGSRVILSDRIPANATYVAGSSRLLVAPAFDVVLANPDGSTLPDPIQSGDRLYWLLPTDTDPKNVALIQGLRYKLAHEGTLSMPTDRVGVILVSEARPAVIGNNEANQRNVLAANNPFASAGGELQLLEGDASVLSTLQSLVKPEVTRVIGGPASSIKVRLEGSNDLTGSNNNQGVLVIEAFDAKNQYANDEFVTLEISNEPLIPDAAPAMPGYQAKLERGQARLPIRLGSTEAELLKSDLAVLASIDNPNGTIRSNGQYAIGVSGNGNGDRPEAQQIPVPASQRPFVGAGVVKLEADFGVGAIPTFSLEGSFKAFARGTVLGDALLTIAANQTAFYTPNEASIWSFEGDLLPAANAFERFPITGDASTRGSETRSSDGFYVRLERGLSYGTYGQITPGFTGLLSAYGANFNGFQGELRDSGYGINGFAAIVPNADQSLKTQGDGTSLYRLPNGPLRPTSERVVVLTFERDNPSIERSRRTLLAQADYALDYESGVLRLAKPLNSTDPNGNPQFLLVEFASESSSAPREIRAGVQARLGAEQGASLTATALTFKPGAALFSLGAAFRNENLQLGVEAGYSNIAGTSTSTGSAGLGLGAQASYSTPAFQIQLRYRELFPGYVNPESATSTPGRAFGANLTLPISSSFKVDANLTHNQNFVSNAVDSSAGLRLTNDFGWFSANLGLFGSLKNNPDKIDAYATGGLAVPLGPISFAALGRLPITAGTDPDATLSLDYAITPSVGLRLQDTLTFAAAGLKQNLSLGARGGFGNNELIRVVTGNSDAVAEANNSNAGTTNLAADYTLSSTDGNAGRTRLNIETSIPLGSNWSTQLGGEANFASTNTGAASLGLRYVGESAKLGLKAEYGFQPTGTKQLYSAGLIWQINEGFTVSPSLEYGILPTVTTQSDGTTSYDGGRYSIAAAIRADRWNVLVNNSGRFGFYAPKGNSLEGEIQGEYTASERFSLRPGFAYKLESNVFTALAGLGATWWFTDVLGIGGQVVYAWQPSTNTARLAAGLEADWRFGNGLILSGGYNFVGFDGFGSFKTDPGFYLRLEWLFNETLWTR